MMSGLHVVDNMLQQSVDDSRDLVDHIEMVALVILTLTKMGVISVNL
jgi:hypothetical protein